MRLEERRTLLVLLVAGTVGTVLFFPAIYFFALWLAPPRPIAEATAAPSLLREALWARADGGRATELKPVNPINFIHHRVCRALAARHDVAATRAERRAECLKQLPAIQGVDYLSGLHIREHNVAPGFREGITQFATSRIGDSRTDPWCGPDVAVAMRNRILASMRNNGAIPERDVQEAFTASLELAPPPEGRPPCDK